MLRFTATGLVASLALVGPVSAQEQPAEPPTEAPAAAAPEAEAPAEPQAAEAADYDASTVLATVNGTDITLGHVVVLRERLSEQIQSLPDETLMKGLVDQLVDQALLAETLSASPEDDPLPVRLHLDNERRAALAARAVTEHIATEVTDEEIQAAYGEAVEGFEPQPEFNASHIIVPTEEEAATLKAEIEGGAEFAEVAQEHSQDAAAAQGGSLGWFGVGQMVPEFEIAVEEMEVGEIAGPVQTQFGWHLIRLDDTRQTEPPAIEAIRGQLVDQLGQQKLMAEIEALRSAGDIDRFDTGVPASAVRDDALFEE